jgi:RNA polymerase sigma factor (sigma-70 family)
MTDDQFPIVSIAEWAIGLDRANLVGFRLRRVSYIEMQAKADAQLLREYVRLGSEAAFGEIVARYTDLIYSAVLRQFNCADLAEDVAQSVFTDLARKAPSLAGKLAENGTIVGWLYRGTRYAVSKRLRAEQRRHIRERQVMQDFDPAPATSPDWERVRPRLDEALADLGEEDRQAMLLRYFQNQDFQAIGAALGISDDTAQKRVARALEKLRTRLARHGITTTAAMLSAVLSTNAIQTAPVGLAARLAGASLAGAAAPTATTLTIMTLTSFKTGIVATGIAAGLAVWVAAEHRSLDRLQGENAALSQQISQLRQQLQPPLSPIPPAGENSDGDELEKLRREHADLLRLRGEVGVLRATVEKNQAELAAAQSENARMVALGQAEAKGVVTVNALKMIGLASSIYAANNGGMLPTDIGQIQDQLAGMPGSRSGVGTNSFEFFNYGTPLSTTSPPDLLYAREKLPRQTPDGPWYRAYLLRDGAVQVAQSEDGNFDTWEQDWLQSHQPAQ